MSGAITMVPQPFQVVRRYQQAADTVTLVLRTEQTRVSPWRPGQFCMIYAYGVGEVPISISGGDDEATMWFTVREVGAVSRAICAAPVGASLGVRGPFGHPWPDPPAGTDVVFLAGGIGLAPLRAEILSTLDVQRAGRVSVLIGARTPADLLFRDEYDPWRQRGAQVLVTVDRADADWTGHVGVITTLIDSVTLTETTSAYICGPEMMMRLCGRELVDRGVAASSVYVSLERDMRCGNATCGHCQLGPLLLCRDGPVVSFEVAEPLVSVGEL